MRKYHVAVEASSSESIMSMMGGGFAIKYFTVGMDDGESVNAETLYEVINRDREHKTGNVIAWSRIEENGDRQHLQHGLPRRYEANGSRER